MHRLRTGGTIITCNRHWMLTFLVACLSFEMNSSKQTTIEKSTYASIILRQKREGEEQGGPSGWHHWGRQHPNKNVIFMLRKDHQPEMGRGCEWWRCVGPWLKMSSLWVWRRWLKRSSLFEVKRVTLYTGSHLA